MTERESHYSNGAPRGGEVRGVRVRVDGKFHSYYRTSKPWEHIRDWVMTLCPSAKTIEVREESSERVLKPAGASRW